MIRTVQAICWPVVLSLSPAGALLSEEINQMIVFTRGHVYKRSRTLRDLGRLSYFWSPLLTSYADRRAHLKHL